MTTATTGGRQHTYLSGEEREELERLKREHASSASYVLRMGLRLLAGLPVPREFREERADAARR